MFFFLIFRSHDPHIIVTLHSHDTHMTVRGRKHRKTILIIIFAISWRVQCKNHMSRKWGHLLSMRVALSLGSTIAQFNVREYD